MKLSPTVCLCSEVEVLGPLAERLLTLRASFFDYLDTLPEPYRSTIKQHYIERLVRSEDRYMLGEYAPLLLAQLLEIPEEDADGITIPWLLLYECSLLFDDVVDIKGSCQAEWVLCAQFLYDYCISAWGEWFEQYPALWAKFREYHAQAVTAAFEEVQRSKNSSPDSLTKMVPEVHVAMGRKAALVKFCATVLSLQFKRRLLSVVEEEAIDSLCAGIQLLDDLTDSVEDHKSGRDHYGVRLAIERLVRRDGIGPTDNCLDSDQLTAILVFSGGFSEMARLAEGYLIRGLSALPTLCDTLAARYLRSISDSCRVAAETTDRVLQANVSLIDRMRLSLYKMPPVFSELVEREPYRNTWRQIIECVRGLATASN